MVVVLVSNYRFLSLRESFPSRALVAVPQGGAQCTQNTSDPFVAEATSDTEPPHHQQGPEPLKDATACVDSFFDRWPSPGHLRSPRLG